MVAVGVVAAVGGVTVGMREVVLGMKEVVELVVGVEEVTKVEGEVVVIVVEVEMGVGMAVDVAKTVELPIDCSLLHGEQRLSNGMMSHSNFFYAEAR